jgi:uncharacterized membrane-anchored protein
VAYRDPDEDRTVQEALAQEAAAWVDALEAARVAREQQRPRKWLLWFAIAVGTGLGGAVAAVVARVIGVVDPSAVLVVGGVVGFAAGTGVALRLAVPKRLHAPRR